MSETCKVPGSFDARDWAQEFIKVSKTLDVEKRLDEEWLIGWFANAIMRGFDDAGRMSEWQPIETAPKDGTSILVFWRDHDGGGRMPPESMNIVWWDDDLNLPYRWRQQEGDLAMHKDAFGWWMPLPEPPTGG